MAASGFEGLDDAGTLVPCWAKPAADGRGWMLRLHETFGHRGTAKLKLAPGMQAHRTDLSETPIEGGPVTEIVYTPYVLISLRITRA